jgi:sulfofructose kinase
MSIFDIVCVGSAKCDTLARVPHPPGKDERFLTDAIMTAPGGNANTAAAAAVRQGIKVALCTTLGCDPSGRYLVGEMERLGIDTRFVVQRPDVETPQSINVACTDSATRFIITVPAPPIQWEAAVQMGASWVHFDAEGFRMARGAIAAGRVCGRVSVDAGIAIGTRDLTGIDLYAPTLDQIV